MCASPTAACSASPGSSARTASRSAPRATDRRRSVRRSPAGRGVLDDQRRAGCRRATARSSSTRASPTRATTRSATRSRWSPRPGRASSRWSASPRYGDGRLAGRRDLRAVRPRHRAGVRRSARLHRCHRRPRRRQSCPTKSWPMRSRRRCRPISQTETLTGAEITKENQSAIETGLELLHHLPHGVLAHRHGRRLLRDLQRVLDHGGAAPAGERSDSRRRCATCARSPGRCSSRPVVGRSRRLVSRLDRRCRGLVRAEGVPGRRSVSTSRRPRLQLLPRTIVLTMVRGHRRHRSVGDHAGFARRPSLRRWRRCATRQSNTPAAVAGACCHRCDLRRDRRGRHRASSSPVPAPAARLRRPARLGRRVDPRAGAGPRRRKVIGTPVPQRFKVTGRMAQGNACAQPEAHITRGAAPVLIGCRAGDRGGAAGRHLEGPGPRDLRQAVRRRLRRQDRRLHAASVGSAPISPTSSTTIPEVAVGRRHRRRSSPRSTARARTVTLVDPTTVGEVFDLHLTSGSYADLSTSSMMVSDKKPRATT